jgi:hypothetical protein
MFNWVIDILFFVKNYLPAEKRQAIRVSWLTALLQPIGNLWSTLNAYNNVISASIKQNILTDVLQADLRSKWAGTSAGIIYVKTNYDEFRTCLFGWPDEQNTLQADEVMNDVVMWDFDPNNNTDVPKLCFPEEYQLANDYTIIIPTTLSSQAATITAYCNSYKAAAKRFNYTIQDIP